MTLTPQQLPEGWKKLVEEAKIRNLPSVSSTRCPDDNSYATFEHNDEDLVSEIEKHYGKA